MGIKLSRQHPLRLPPLIKWPGGKRAILNSILPVLPGCTKRYFEPFLGDEALYFHLQPQKAVLSDINEELINLYLQIKNSPHQLILILKTYENSEENYYRIREQSPNSVATVFS